MRTFRIPTPGEAHASAEMARMVNMQASAVGPRRQPPDRFTRLKGETISTIDALARFFQGGSFYYQFVGYENPIQLCDSQRDFFTVELWIDGGAEVVVRRA
jgi:hypothetical protein